MMGVPPVPISISESTIVRFLALLGDNFHFLSNLQGSNVLVLSIPLSSVQGDCHCLLRLTNAVVKKNSIKAKFIEKCPLLSGTEREQGEKSEIKNPKSPKSWPYGQNRVEVGQMMGTVSAAYTGELGTGHFLRYKRKSVLTGDFYFKNGFWGFKNLRYKRKSGLSESGLSGGHCTNKNVNTWA